MPIIRHRWTRHGCCLSCPLHLATKLTLTFYLVQRGGIHLGIDADCVIVLLPNVVLRQGALPCVHDARDRRTTCWHCLQTVVLRPGALSCVHDVRDRRTTWWHRLQGPVPISETIFVICGRTVDLYPDCDNRYSSWREHPLHASPLSAPPSLCRIHSQLQECSVVNIIAKNDVWPRIPLRCLQHRRTVDTRFPEIVAQLLIVGF
mmetsp:Transcript_58613/g.156054  ORF Transcript_58613/g.156054 Transcript_58613/m.156054 type:complete len:204 (+) Transcript_58613:1400-2011(+)